MGAPSDADAPPKDPKTEADAKQPKSLPPVEPKASEPAEPTPETAPLAPLPDGEAPAAATAAEADVFPMDSGAAKKKRKKKRKGSESATAALQAEDPQSSAVPGTKFKKKKINKAKLSNSVPSLDDAPAPDDEESLEPQAHEVKQVTQLQLMAICSSCCNQICVADVGLTSGKMTSRLAHFNMCA